MKKYKQQTAFSRGHTFALRKGFYTRRSREKEKNWVDNTINKVYTT
jgi:hypothetical protein